MKITEIKQAIKYFWVKTLVSGKRVLSILIQLNYLAILVLILINKLVLTWLFMVFLVITLVALLILEGKIPIKPVDIEVDLGNK